jgi:hypothetical protein
VAKVVLKRKFIAIHAYMLKKEKDLKLLTISYHV